MLLFAACEKELQVYDAPECRLNFYYSDTERDKFEERLTESSFSFIYAGSDVLIDTVWFEAETMGFVYGENRHYELTQIMTDGNNAIPGVHYVAFDDAEYQNKCLYVPAKRARFRIPVVVKRDASLQQKDVVLRFSFKENTNFRPGYEKYQVRTLTISASLSKPLVWETAYGGYFSKYYYGGYGPVKHQFLIDETGEKWDDEYIEKLCNGDSAYFSYLLAKLTRRLEEVNAERVANGLPVLQEDNEDGTTTPVAFPQ